MFTAAVYRLRPFSRWYSSFGATVSDALQTYVKEIRQLCDVIWGKHAEEVGHAAEGNARISGRSSEAGIQVEFEFRSFWWTLELLFDFSTTETETTLTFWAKQTEPLPVINNWNHFLYKRPQKKSQIFLKNTQSVLHEAETCRRSEVCRRFSPLNPTYQDGQTHKYLIKTN